MSKTNLRLMTIALALVTIVFAGRDIGLMYGTLAIAVPVAWLFVFCLPRRLTEFRKAPKRSVQAAGGKVWPVVLSFSMSCLIAPAIVAVAESLNNTFASVSAGNVLMYFVLRAGLVEELLKLTAVLIVIKYLAPDAIKHPREGVVLACAAALGFASYENIYHNLYLVQIQSGIAEAFFLGAFIRVPLHALYASFWGATLGIAYFMRGTNRFFLMLLGVIPAIFLHGLWDTIAQSQGTATGVLLTLLYASFWYCYWQTSKRCEAVQLVSTSGNSEQV